MNVMTTIRENRLVMISKIDCYFCILTKALLKLKNIDYVEIIYDDSMLNDINYLKKFYEIKTYPMIFIDQKYFGGYKELNEL